jgi:hypothetical protein
MKAELSALFADYEARFNAWLSANPDPYGMSREENLEIFDALERHKDRKALKLRVAERRERT